MTVDGNEPARAPVSAAEACDAASPLALYIHWPFCLSKCPYCDFNSHVRARIDQARFAAALLTELRWEAARLGPRPLGSIFFGGGTPSLMEPATVAALIEAARA
jgi:coproporphyrinogen III oxidase-like Fe-S oxidoreductase